MTEPERAGPEAGASSGRGRAEALIIAVSVLFGAQGFGLLVGVSAPLLFRLLLPRPQAAVESGGA